MWKVNSHFKGVFKKHGTNITLGPTPSKQFAAYNFQPSKITRSDYDPVNFHSVIQNNLDIRKIRPVLPKLGKFEAMMDRERWGAQGDKQRARCSDGNLVEIF